VRILINSLNYYPELTGVGKYTGEMVEWLSQNGHEVRVVTAPPYYPEWSVVNGYSAYRYKVEVIDGAKIYRCPLYVPSKPSGLKRILHLASFAISSFPVLLSQFFWKPHVAITIEPPLFSAPFVWLLSRLFGSRCWLHIQDFEVDAAFELGILSSKRLKHFVLKVESGLKVKFDRVSTISTQMLKRLDIKGVPAEKQVLFPNWVDLDHIYPMERSGVFRNETGVLEESIVFLYSGNMGEKQGLEIVIEAARALFEHKNIVFVMCGQGAAYKRLLDMAEGLDNIHWLSLQPLDRLNELLNMADVHLLPQRADAADLVMPSKLTGMLASGRPVLATALDGTQIAQALETTGVIVPPEDTDLFVKAIVELSENEERRQNLGKNARQYAIDYLGKDAILSRFEASLRECVGQNRK